MIQFNLKLLLVVIDKVLYMAFLCTGIYFIYQGKVLERFLLERTDFSEYDEAITELPTLVAYVDPLDPNILKLGRDFNISYGAADIDAKDITTHLELGENSVEENSTLRIEMEQIREQNVFKITPVNFTPGSRTDYVLIYTFENSSVDSHKTLEVGMRITPENNSVHITGKSRDGAGGRLQSKPGLVTNSILFC